MSVPFPKSFSCPKVHPDHTDYTIQKQTNESVNGSTVKMCTYGRKCAMRTSTCFDNHSQKAARTCLDVAVVNYSTPSQYTVYDPWTKNTPCQKNTGFRIS